MADHVFLRPPERPEPGAGREPRHLFLVARGGAVVHVGPLALGRAAEIDILGGLAAAIVGDRGADQVAERLPTWQLAVPRRVERAGNRGPVALLYDIAKVIQRQPEFRGD